VERQNLSVRNYARRFARKSLGFSKACEYLSLYLEAVQAWFNFVKPHLGLRVPSRSQEGSTTRGLRPWLEV